MLGEYLGELQGKDVTRRVVDITNGPTMEATVLREGGIRGVKVTDMVTVNVTSDHDGTNQGYGIGFMTTTDNSEVITYSGKGIGKSIDSNEMEFRGSLFFNKSSSRDGKLSFLDNLVVLFENEDNVETSVNKIKLWEWK